MADFREDEPRKYSAEEELEKETVPEGDGEEIDARPAWQRMKEGWYDKVPLNLRQLDIIIGVCVAGLLAVTVAIILDAAGVF